MTSDALDDASTHPRVLLVSNRGIHNHPARCLAYELEDAIHAMDDVLLLAPNARDRSSGLMHKVLKTVGPWTGTDLRLQPRTGKHANLPIYQDFELLLVVVQTVRDLRELSQIAGWQHAALRSVCLVEELWMEHVRDKDVRLLEGFDHIVTECAHVVPALEARLGIPVTYLPPCVDMLRFCPRDLDAPRPIDAYWMGRRASGIHQLLQGRARTSEFFYLFDTARFAAVADPAEHRELLARNIQRTKYFLVSRAKVNEPGLTSRQAEVGFRYFEGAAGGAVLIGETPDAPSFVDCFGWQDSVVEPAAGQTILGLIDALDRDPQRVARIRRRNTVQSLRRHDAAHRWRDILRLVDLPASQGLQGRLRVLEDRAAAIDAGPSRRDDSLGATTT